MTDKTLDRVRKASPTWLTQPKRESQSSVEELRCSSTSRAIWALRSFALRVIYLKQQKHYYHDEGALHRANLETCVNICAKVLYTPRLFSISNSICFIFKNNNWKAFQTESVRRQLDRAWEHILKLRHLKYSACT